MPEQLTSGRFFGQTLRERKVGDLFLADVSYASGLRRAEPCPRAALLLPDPRGGYTEAYGRRMRVCRPGSAAFHPPGERHAEVFGERAVASFNVELGPAWLRSLREVGGVLDQPVEFQGGEIAALGFRLFAELRRSDSASPVAVEGLTSGFWRHLSPGRPSQRSQGPAG